MLTELTIHKFKSWSHETLESRSPWDDEAKLSDDFLTPLFKIYFKKLSFPNLMNKKIFCELAEFKSSENSPEIESNLDKIAGIAARASHKIA